MMQGRRFNIRHSWLLLLISLSGCAYYPAVTQSQSYAQECRMLTRQLTLDATVINIRDCGDTAESCLVLIVGIPAATLVVSGSVVLLGNTLHWLEYHGHCEQGFVRQTLLDV